jgi:hypothetical protein
MVTKISQARQALDHAMQAGRVSFRRSARGSVIDAYDLSVCVPAGECPLAELIRLWKGKSKAPARDLLYWLAQARGRRLSADEITTICRLDAPADVHATIRSAQYGPISSSQYHAALALLAGHDRAARR